MSEFVRHHQAGDRDQHEHTECDVNGMEARECEVGTAEEVAADGDVLVQEAGIFAHLAEQKRDPEEDRCRHPQDEALARLLQRALGEEDRYAARQQKNGVDARLPGDQTAVRRGTADLRRPRVDIGDDQEDKEDELGGQKQKNSEAGLLMQQGMGLVHAGGRKQVQAMR